MPPSHCVPGRPGPSLARRRGPLRTQGRWRALLHRKAPGGRQVACGASKAILAARPESCDAIMKTQT